MGRHRNLPGPDAGLSSRREELISFMAHPDPLTGLPNRIQFMELLEDSLAKGDPGAILYLDLNRFKEVSDRHGHQEGERRLNLLPTGSRPWPCRTGLKGRRII